MKYITLLGLCFLCFLACETTPKHETKQEALAYSKNRLNYQILPKQKEDKDGLMFSDQGAWFAYGFSDFMAINGFSGPFLMTQDNGVWASKSLANFYLKDADDERLLNFQKTTNTSYSSHLEVLQQNKRIQLKKELVFLSSHTALQRFTVTNVSGEAITIKPSFNSYLFNVFSEIKVNDNTIEFHSEKTPAIGYLTFVDEKIEASSDAVFYLANLDSKSIAPQQSVSFVIAQSFIFPEYDWEAEQKRIQTIDFDAVLAARKSEKNAQLEALVVNRKPQFKDTIYAEVLAKAQLTLQNNWRIAAGEIKHQGLFPSYHYKWFNGFWTWDSWKHAVGLSYYDVALAKAQMKQLFAFQQPDGFILDCVYRDTLIEPHNTRNTKPPLSAWAVAKIYERDTDLEFVKYMYPKLKKYHNWWYIKRDHDQDGLCEYGSTDGTLIAAKWESGMDNAIRFDASKILKNTEDAYSINQESVDLNSYLYAEKLYLAQLAKVLSISEDAKRYTDDAEALKTRIQMQFYDVEDGWFYDTNLDGDEFIKGEGSEGWTALWANAATPAQAKAVKTRMMHPDKFFTKVPFQTMSADHKKFDPLQGYWRGPNWLDQAYFGVKGLRNYGFNTEADQATIQILKGAEGLLKAGPSIRENYHPITGEGLNAHNFSWSAAHIIMLLM